MLKNLAKTLSRKVLHNFVISTEGRNHTSNSAKIGDYVCRVSNVISPFGRNDKLYGILLCWRERLARAFLCVHERDARASGGTAFFYGI